MPREQSLFIDLISRLDYLRQMQRQMTLVLGGSSGSGGGTGGGPGGFEGLLPQSRVTGDTTESFNVTSGSPVSLVSNLNNIRGWLKPAHFFWADTTTPVSTQLQIATGVWFHDSAQVPLDFAVKNTPSVTAPSTNPRYALLTVDKYGNLLWSYGSESASPVEPNPPSATSGSMPLWLIYQRTSGSVIQRYDDSLSHYIYADRRPIWDWGIGGAGGGVLDPSSPLDVGSSASVGTSGSSSHGDHVHRGLTGLLTPPGAATYGLAELLGSGDISVTQSSGSFTVSASSGSFVPRVHDVNGAYHTGFPLRTNEGGLGTLTQPTAGAIPIGKTDSTYAPNYLTPGSNISITNSSGSIIIANTMSPSGIVFDATSPQDVGGSASVGSSGSPPHADHIHRGVTGVLVPSNSAAYGLVELLGSGDISVTQSSGSFTVGASSGSFLPRVHGINDVYHNNFPLSPANGGTGINNGTNTLTLGGSFGGTLVFNVVGKTLTVNTDVNMSTIAGDANWNIGTSTLQISSGKSVSFAGSLQFGGVGGGATNFNVTAGKTLTFVSTDSYNLTLNSSLTWPANSTGWLTNNGAGGLSWGNITPILDSTSPLDVGASAVVGTSGSPAHGDHVHRGVHSVSVPGSSFAYNDIVLQPGNNISLSQSSGSISIAGSANSLVFDSASPLDIGASALVGTSGSPPHSDHAHRGITGLLTPPGAAAYGIAELLGSGDISVTQSSGSFTVGGSSGSYLPRVHDINGFYHTNFPLTPARGGTGVANTSSLTLGGSLTGLTISGAIATPVFNMVTSGSLNLNSNTLVLSGGNATTTITGGGTIALGGFTVTFPITVAQTNAITTSSNPGAAASILATDASGVIQVQRVVTPGFTNNSSLVAGALEIQSYAINNNWITDNLYYGAGGWTYRGTGYGVVHYFISGGWRVQTAPSGTAGNAATMTTQFQVYNDGTVFLNNKITTYNNVATEGYGIGAIVDDVALTNQGADIGSTNFTNAGVAGTYFITAYIVTTSTDVGAGSVDVQLSWNDGGAARSNLTILSSSLPLTSTTFRFGTQVVKLSTGSISYRTTGGGTYGTARYALYMSCIRLS